MSTAANFTGPVPSFYDRYLGPVLFEPYADDLVRRLPQGETLRVLELACGTGIVTRHLRGALPATATLVATDLNEPMVTYARAAVGQEQRIDWRTADAQALPFDDASFDVVVCQFGFMFLPNKPKGFGEARRVLAPGGLLLGNVWHSMDENPYARAMHTRLAQLFPNDPPRFFETPYGYADAARLRADLAQGGWDDIELEDVRIEGRSPSAAEFTTGFVRGSPLSHQLIERGADLDEMLRELMEVVIPVGGDTPFRPQLAATIITGRR